MKTILFNVTATVSVKSNTGIQKFTRELIFELKRYFLVIPVRFDLFKNTWRLLNLYEEFNLILRKKKFQINSKRKPASTLYNWLYSILYVDRLQVNRISHIKFDFLINTEVGGITNKISLDKNLYYQKSIAVLHDIIPINYSYFSTKKLKFYFFYYIKILLSYNYILPVSQYSKNTAFSFLKQKLILISKNFFVGIKPGISSYFTRIKYPQFFLRNYTCVNSLEKRKNYICTIKTLFNTWTSNFSSVKLLIIGGTSNKYSREVLKIIFKLSRNFYPILYYKSLSEQKLIALYNITGNILYLSSIEGYGTPITEALTFRKNSLSGIGGSLKKVTGDVGFRFSTTKANSFLNKFVQKIYLNKLNRHYQNRMFNFTAVQSWNSYLLRLFKKIK